MISDTNEYYRNVLSEKTNTLKRNIIATITYKQNSILNKKIILQPNFTKTTFILTQ